MIYPLDIDDEPDEATWGAGRVLAVKLAGPRGERWSAVGVGETLESALTWARDSAPSGTSWLIGSWVDLYGD
jgi:hypothetical protein